MYQEIEGDLIELALNGNFDVIAHGCNCFCRMESGIAKQMALHFGCDKFDLEDSVFTGLYNKLGQIDFEYLHYSNWDKKFEKYPDEGDTILYSMYVVNVYSQYKYGKNHPDGDENPFDYEAFTICMRKMNQHFNGSKIGLPKIGAGLAGGDWERIRTIIQKELKDCHVTVVTLPSKL